MQIDKRGWLLRSLDATSQWMNTVLLGGDPNECISGRCWREQRRVYRAIDWLFFLVRGESNHCRRAYNKDNSWAGHRMVQIRRSKKGSTP